MWIGLTVLIVGIVAYTFSFGPALRKVLGTSHPDERRLRIFHSIYRPVFELAMHWDFLAKGIMAEARVPGGLSNAELSSLRQSWIERGIVRDPKANGRRPYNFDLEP